MKNFLMTGMIAVSVMGMVSSCSHDDSSSDYDEVTNNYISAFNRTFGEPAGNQDWGFDQVGVSASRMTRAINPTYDFDSAIPKRPTTTEMSGDKFKTNVDDIPAYTSINGGNGYATGVSYITGSVNVNIWGGGGTAENGWQNSGGEVYFYGDCDLSGKNVNIAGNTTIYVVKDANVTLDNGFSQNCKVYVGENAKLTIKNNVSTGNVSYYIKNGGFEAKNQLVVNGGHEFFIENGQVKVGGEFQIENATYYAKNTPLTIGGMLNLIVRDNPALFYNEGGEIKCTGKLLNNSSKFYTDANSTFAEISENGNCVVYNGAQAKMISKGDIRVTTSNSNGSNGSVLINDGDLEGTYLGTEGGAFFENNGVTTISGNTIVNSNYNTWVNNGTYNTQYFIYNAGSSEVINNCRLYVSEDFDINLGDNPGNSSFRMDSNAGVVTKNLNAGGVFTFNNGTFNGGPFYIYMNSGSVFEVTQTATINATKADYGIYCLGDSWAVLHANKIQCAPGQEYQGNKVTYGGKLAVISETTHFPQGKSGQYDYINYANGFKEDYIYASNFNTGDPNISIAATACNPGFSRNNGTVDPDPDPDPITPNVRIIAEDLTAKQNSDFDFNDVVFDVTFTSETTATITLQAAGGTLPLTVAGKNVHDLFKADEKEMINTNAPAKDGGVKREPVSFDITGINRANNGKDIAIHVYKEGKWIELKANKGVAAAKIAVKPGFEWCDEYQDIQLKYPKFKEWVQDKDIIWY